MEATRLVEGYRQILRTIYSPKEYYARALDCLRRVRQDAAEIRYDSFLTEAAAFVRVVMTLGVFDRSRAQFWRFVIRVLKEHRKRFAEAMLLAAMGYHFRKLTEEYCH